MLEEKPFPKTDFDAYFRFDKIDQKIEIKERIKLINSGYVQNISSSYS